MSWFSRPFEAVSEAEEAIKASLSSLQTHLFSEQASLSSLWDEFKAEVSYVRRSLVRIIRQSYYVFDVKDYGAKGDGVTDDTVAIRACIDAMPPGSRFYMPPPSTFYRITGTIEIANKQGCAFVFPPGSDTALAAYDEYPIKYDGATLTGYEDPVIRVVGCVRCDFYGLAVNANSKTDYGLWFSGLNAYTGSAPTTALRQRSIGCQFYSYAAIGCNVSAGQIGEETSTSSQTDLVTFHKSYFAVTESATQIALDTQPTTFGVKLVGANTYVDFEHCQFTGDYAIYANSGSYHFERPYLLGDAGLYINAKTCDVTMSQPYGEGFMGRPVWLDAGDGTDAKNLNIAGAKFFPGSKSIATIDSVNDVDAGTDIITETAHGYVTGDILAYANGGGTSIGGLTTGGKYWAIRTSADGFKVASSLANAQAGTAINISDGVGSSHTFTWQPAPMRFQSNMNVTITGSFAEDWITDNAGSTGQKPIYTDIGNIWLHPTDHSSNPDLRLTRRSTYAGASNTSSLFYDHNVRRQVVNETAAPATMGAAWSGVDVFLVNSASGNTYTLAAAFKGMSIRVWKAGTGTAIVNKASSGGDIIRSDTGAVAATDVRASSTSEQGFIQFDCVDDGYWRCTSRLSMAYDSGTLGFVVGGAIIGGSVPRILTTNTTAVGNITTGEDDLMTYSVPADTLATNGDSVNITAAGRFAVATVRLRAYFGSDLLFDSGALVIGGAADWNLTCEIFRTGATTQKAIVKFNGVTYLPPDYTTPGRTLSSANTFKLTGEATLTDDVIQELCKVRFEPAS